MRVIPIETIWKLEVQEKIALPTIIGCYYIRVVKESRNTFPIILDGNLTGPYY